KPFSEIIIQIQGDQYRWCALKHINRKATEEDKSELFDYFKSKDWFVEYIKGDKVIKHNKKEYKTSLRNSFCAYSAPSDDPNDMYYCMVYQYYTLQGTNDYRFDDLIQKILTDLDKAYCICLETNAISQ
ncbi:MAG: hypothetical protein J5874_00565, partial [Oscillospiraceae bacterium]|nr:hypothetical protein [Oscillospiraceae bacterium]